MLARYYPEYKGWITVYIPTNIETAYPLAGKDWSKYIEGLKEREGLVKWR